MGSRWRVKGSGLRRVSKQSGGLFARRRRKHGGAKRPSPRFLEPVAKPWLDWRKIHLGIDEETLEIRGVEVTSSDVGDVEQANATGSREPARMLPELLDQIPPDQEIASVTADGAYDTRKCHDAIAERGAAAVIPPRRKGKPWKAVTAGAVARNEALRASKHLGRALWRRWSGYHRRSRAETKMHCVKLLGQRLMARDFDRQVAELQVRVIRRLARTGGVRLLTPERLHRARHPGHEGRGIGLSGERGRPAISRFVQQSRFTL